MNTRFQFDTFPAKTRCETCGRVIPLRYVTIGCDLKMKPDDL
jgi:hypothetical protein